MKSYKELLKEKTQIRLTNPERHLALNMILDGASKLAKKELVEVTESHLRASVRSLIASTEGTISLLKEKGVDASKYEAELAQYLEFRGPEMSDAGIAAICSIAIASCLPELRTKKNMKNISASVLEQLSDEDPKRVNRILASMLH